MKHLGNSVSEFERMTSASHLNLFPDNPHVHLTNQPRHDEDAKHSREYGQGFAKAGGEGVIVGDLWQQV